MEMIMTKYLVNVESNIHMPSAQVPVFDSERGNRFTDFNARMKSKIKWLIHLLC